MPPSVATSQLPMVSAHAIKEPLRTPSPRRFWTGVAQITRSRDRAFTVSHCSLWLFSISSIWRLDRCTGNRSAGFPPCAPPTAPNRATDPILFAPNRFSLSDRRESRHPGNQAVARVSAATSFDRDSEKIYHAPRIVLAATRIPIKADEILESLIFRA
jgi:hypothetical protein